MDSMFNCTPIAIDTSSTFKQRLDMSVKTEKKNGLTYVSWSDAVGKLGELDPTATWSFGEVRWYGEQAMVECTVNAFGVSRTSQLPVLDYKTQPVNKPNVFQINTAQQRCLAKAIALHGIGLKAYQGEDIPQEGV